MSETCRARGRAGHHFTEHFCCTGGWRWHRVVAALIGVLVFIMVNLVILRRRHAACAAVMVVWNDEETMGRMGRDD